MSSSKPKIKFTASARAQFLEAVRFIRKDKLSAAKRFRDKALKALQRLSKFPLSGRPLPEFPELPYREVIVPPYRFFYSVREHTVWIVAVWHGAQEPEQPEQAK